MTSIRRIASPAYHNRSYQNVDVDFSIDLPKQSLNMPYFATFYGESRRFIGLLFPLRRKVNQELGLWVFRSMVFFLLGFLAGMAPFGHVGDVKSHNLSFEVKSPQTSVKLDAIRALKRDDFVLGMVKLGEETGVSMKQKFVNLPKKQLIVVTPTYNRPFQAFYLNRLSQVLSLTGPPLLWIVVEMGLASTETSNILRYTGVMSRHLVCTKNSSSVKDRGVHQRNTALQHIEQHRLDGIVYFADDDNIYSLELFESIRGIRHFGTWPVAMLAASKNKAVVEGPVCNGSQVIGWHTNEKSKRLRRFHVDMSGFAFNSTILWDPHRWKRLTQNPVRQLDTVKEGFQETTFIEQVIEDESQMEGMSFGCSRIMNWHLHLEVHNLVYPQNWLHQNNIGIDLLVN